MATYKLTKNYYNQQILYNIIKKNLEHTLNVDHLVNKRNSLSEFMKMVTIFLQTESNNDPSRLFQKSSQLLQSHKYSPWSSICKASIEVADI